MYIGTGQNKHRGIANTLLKSKPHIANLSKEKKNMSRSNLHLFYISTDSAYVQDVREIGGFIA